MMRTVLISSLLPLSMLVTGCNQDLGSGAADVPGTTVVASAESGPVSIEVSTLSLEAESGEPIELVVTLKAPEDARARLLLEPSAPMGQFDVLRNEEAQVLEDVLSVADRRRLLVSTFESGSVVLPPIEAEWGDDRRLITEPIEFSIRSLIEGEFDPADYAEIRGPVDDSLPESGENWILPVSVAAGATILVLLAIALVVAGRRRPRPRIPHEWALAELARIRDEDPVSQGATDELYARIENVLRWYVAFRFSIDAPDQTSKELLTAAADHEGIDDDARVTLERLVRNGDRIKFAGGAASRNDCTEALESARGFVERTIPASKEEAA